MEAKDKAVELFNRMYQVDDIMGNYPMCKNTAKQCAIICVNEINNQILLNTNKDDPYSNVFTHDYWNEVIKEIEQI